jgi:tRNA-specific 2-thiouridylase
MLLSGGVDSSVALQLLRDQGGHTLKAYYLKVWLEEEAAYPGDCPWEEDLRYVRAVCEHLDIPFEIVPLQTEYLERIVAHTLSELRAGRTPSPDIFCNQRIKFGAFLDRIGDSCDKVASGHYARIEAGDGRFLLKRSPDRVKDQTYFLSHLSQDQLSRILFPIGHLAKAAVRDLASEFGLPTQTRKDSQGICFLGKIVYRDFIEFHLGQRQGDIIDRESGRKLGEHQGFWFYTIGQRHGLGLSGGPWYVDSKDTERNIIYISHGDQLEQRLRSAFAVSRFNWIAGTPPSRSDLQVKLRHGPDIVDCQVELDSASGRVHLAQPDPGIASGQHAVFYAGDVCLGGGIIS